LVLLFLIERIFFMSLSSSIGSSVWDRTEGGHDLSKRAFIGMLSFWTAAGIGTSAVASFISRGWEINWLFAIGVLVVAIAGIFIALGSDQPVISLLGYMMVTIPFGLLVGPLVALYSTASVVTVLGLTSALVVVLGAVGVIYPGSLEHWGIFLFAALLLLLLGHVGVGIAAAMGVPVVAALGWMDWIGVFLFSAYVVYDMNRAMRVKRTMDNAIDCALAVYLDFANLFIRLLQIMGSSSSND
jgi:FtsH-binding integral membrane protein